MSRASTPTKDLIPANCSVTPTSRCPNNDPNGTSRPPPGGTPPSVTVLPRTLASRKPHPTTPTLSSRRSHRPSTLKLAPSAKMSRNPSHACYCATLRKSQAQIATTCQSLMKVPASQVVVRRSDWGGRPIKRRSLSTGLMHTPSSTLKTTLLPTTMVLHT